MKKIILLSFMAIAVMFIINKAEAATAPIKVMKDNTYIELSVSPIKKDGRVLVPLSDIAKAFNVNIAWEQETKSITYVNNDGYTYKLKVDSTDVEIQKDNNSQTIKIDVAPMIYNNKVFVPVRFIAESFNTNVEWDSFYNVVYVGNCTKLGYYSEFPDVPSFSRISKTEAHATNGMPQQMIYKHGLTTMKPEQGLQAYLKLLKVAGFQPIESEMNYNESFTCADISCEKKLDYKKTLNGFSVIDKNNRIKVKVKADVYVSDPVIDYKNRTKTVYIGNSIIEVRVLDLNPPKFDEYWNVKTVPYNKL